MTSSVFSLLLVVAVAATFLTPPTVRAHPEATPTTHVHAAARDRQSGDYAFGYVVDSPEYRNYQEREEARSGEETRGRFRVALPDNRLQTVLYRANEKGYTALVSYDQHPDFPSLRASVGPIGSAPEIGQSVLDSIRSGENWKNRKDHHKDGRRHDHGPRPSGHGALDNTVVSTPRRSQSTTSRPRPSRVQRPRPTPTRARPSTTTQGKRHQQTTQRTTRRPTTTRGSRAPVAQRLTGAAPQVAPARPSTTPGSSRPSTTPGSSRPSTTQPASLFIAAEDIENPELLNRLITAIREKAAEEGIDTSADDEVSDEASNKKGPHRRYSIGDKASVLSRLRAVVHTVHLAHLSSK